MTILVQAITLMVIFHLKHYIADFILQGKYMLGKFKEKDWMLPLAAHCAVHALFTFCIAAGVFWPTFRPELALWPFILASIDFGIHFVMDRIKASPFLMGRWKNFTADGYEFIQAGYLPPKLIQVQYPTQGNYFEPFLTPKKLQPGDKEHLFRSNTYFWWALGFDQLVHGLTDVLLIYMLLRGVT